MRTQIDSKLLALAKHALMTEYYIQFSHFYNSYRNAGRGLDTLEESMYDASPNSIEVHTHNLHVVQILVFDYGEPEFGGKEYETIIEALKALEELDAQSIYINGTKYFEKVAGEIMWAKSDID